MGKKKDDKPDIVLRKKCTMCQGDFEDLSRGDGLCTACGRLADDLK